ncbi:MAG: hypothetical protein HOM11_16350, partial [Methylococcales bacterium]|nr:hypothetical protein [Methylococcales bacterium]
LFAEKTLTQYDQTTPEFWQQLKNRLRRIIKAYEPDEEDDDEDTVAPVDNSEELARLEAENENLKKRVSNLEMFKKMFFDLQIKVKELTEQGQEIHNQATSIAEANDDGDMLGLLNQYQNSYQEMSAAASNTPPVIQVTQAAGEGVTQVMHVKDTKELNQLKETNSDQHNIITRLRGELQGMQNASSDEINNKTAEIEQQIAKMEKSLAESDMCVQMLENDYSDAMQQVYELEEKLNTQQAETNQLVDTMTMVQNESSTQTETILALQAENASLTSAAEAGNNAQQMIQNFAKESQELMGCMATLEDENDLMTKQVKRLKIKLKKQRNSKASSAAPSTDDANLKAKISEKDKEIMRLQTEYSELEAQYLDAFTKLNS